MSIPVIHAMAFVILLSPLLACTQRTGVSQWWYHATWDTAKTVDAPHAPKNETKLNK